MKKSQNEQIVTTVNHYLKRRQYMDGSSDGLKRERRVRNTRDHIAACTVQCNGSTEAVVSYSSSCIDPVAWDTHYNRMKCFIQDAIEPYRSELYQLLYPLYVHICLELLSAGHRLQAHRFEERYRVIFADMKDAQLMLSALPTLMSSDDVLSNKLTTEFREHKYCVSLSEEAFHYLTRFLKNEDNIIILQLISQRFDISVQPSESVGDTDNQLSGIEEIDYVSTTPHSPDIKPTIDVTLGALQRIIQKIDEGSPPLPSICQYTLLNTYQGLSSVNLSQDERMLCAGFEDSHLAVWSLIPDPLPLSADQLPFNVSHVSLVGDCEEDLQHRLTTLRSSVTSSPECATLRAHSGPVYSSCFIPNSSLLLSASDDKTVRLWDISKRRNVAIYRGHNYPVYCVDVSPVGSLFATSSLDETAKLWSTDRIFPLRTFIGHTRSVNCVRFHANGNYVATCSSDSTVRLWNLQDAQPVRLMHSHRGMVMTLAFSPDGRYLASAGEDRRVKIWDLSTGTLLRDLRGHTDFIYSLAFSQDSEILASGGMDCTIKLWEVNKAVDESSTQSSTEASVVSPSLLGSFSSKSMSVLCLRFTSHNYLVAAGS